MIKRVMSAYGPTRKKQFSLNSSTKTHKRCFLSFQGIFQKMDFLRFFQVNLKFFKGRIKIPAILTIVVFRPSKSNINKKRYSRFKSGRNIGPPCRFKLHFTNKES